MKTMCAALLSVSFLLSANALAGQPDPFNSPIWDSVRKQFLGDDAYVFDERMVVITPSFAENPVQVPVTVDASALAREHEIVEVIAWADLNPIRQLFVYTPVSDQAVANVSLRIKVQQGTVIHAAARTRDGMWYVGGSYVDAAGGGCTTPSVAAADPYWESHLGEMQSRFFAHESGGRYKFRVVHPMDTGLVPGIPEFFIEQVVLSTTAGEALAKLQLFQPVAENPTITMHMAGSDQGHKLWLRDNSGNIFEQAL